MNQTEKSGSGSSRRQGFGRFALRIRVSGVLVFLIVVGTLFSLLSKQFLTTQNLTVIASNAAILAIVASAQALALLTRNVDVSVGSIMGLTAYIASDYLSHNQNAGLQLLFLALALGTLLGAINGLLVAYGKVSSLIATLATMSLYRGATYLYAHGQEIASNKLPRWLQTSVDYRLAGIPLLVMVSMVVVALVAHFLRAYPLGRRIYAVGSSTAASDFYGLRPNRIILLAYSILGLLCGLAGLLYAARIGTVTVVLASGWEMSSLAAAVIGGVSVAGGSGSVVGAALGAVVLATIDNGLVLLGIPEFWRMFIQGSSIVAAALADVSIASGIGKSLLRRRLGKAES
jgi:rhamnose transport system permease protein